MVSYRSDSLIFLVESHVVYIFEKKKIQIEELIIISELLNKELFLHVGSCVKTFVQLYPGDEVERL